MPTVRYDDRSYIVDEKRIWLVSGAIHYFRTPHPLWGDRLLKAKRAGLNCIETYVPWNFHEMQEGKWDFSGDRDVARFIAMAGELGLYVILRPGPYICSEWDFGGFPAWLSTKGGIAYRTNNATYMHYFDKYFAQLLPRLRDLQVTHGGNIILVQNENEYFYTTMPDRLAYCQFITQLIRRGGFDIPIITCNQMSEPKVPDTVECFNTWGHEVDGLKQLRQFQGGAPMMVAEFWDGWFDFWGREHQVKDGREVGRRLLEILGCGAQFNYYMWHGGTNFGFWGSKLITNEAAFQTTSYDFDAPLAEGGGLTKKYYLTKPVNLLASSFGPHLAQCRMDGPVATLADGVAVLSISGPAGLRFAVVTNNGRDEIKTARINLPDGKTQLDVNLELLGATLVPMGLKIGLSVLDYANVMPLGLIGETAIAFHGPAGWEARISVNGVEVRKVIPKAGAPELLEHGGLKILLMESELALRSWAVDGSLVIGPDFVGKGMEEVVPHAGDKQYFILTEQGSLTYKKVKQSAWPKRPAPPKLALFSRYSVCEEPSGDGLEWDRLDRPKDLAAMGILYGYGWYRLQVESERIGKRMIFLSDCEDRAAIYLNGQYLSTWGRGPGASRQPLAASLKRGTNTLVFLADNLGRLKSGRMDEPKGISGPIWEARPLESRKVKLHSDGEFLRRYVPRMYSHLAAVLPRMTMWTADVAIQLPQIQPVHAEWTGLPFDLAVLCNGRQAGFFPAGTGGYGQVTLHNELQKGSNKLTFLMWGDVPAKAMESVRIYQLTNCLSTGGTWSSRKWRMPVASGQATTKGMPTWYRSHFSYAPAKEPLFLKLAGAGKGQLFLNGHNIGRYWNIGPQPYYYLPECWLAQENSLLVFDEQGNPPVGSRLEFCPAGPFAQ